MNDLDSELCECLVRNYKTHGRYGYTYEYHPSKVGALCSLGYVQNIEPPAGVDNDLRWYYSLTEKGIEIAELLVKLEQL